MASNEVIFTIFRLYKNFPRDPLGVGWCSNGHIGAPWNGLLGMGFIEVVGGGFISSLNSDASLLYLIFHVNFTTIFVFYNTF